MLGRSLPLKLAITADEMSSMVQCKLAAQVFADIAMRDKDLEHVMSSILSIKLAMLVTQH